MSVSPAIQALLKDLGSGALHSPAALRELLSRPITTADVAEWIQFDPTNYTRTLVGRGPGWELRLLCWQRQQSTSLHGHGPSACCFRILQGSATEHVIGATDRSWTPGEVVEESMGLVHQVNNLGDEPMVTLHAYSPALPIDRPSPLQGRSVVILGGGFSGVAAAYHLLQRAPPDLRITLVERGPWVGRGIAYGVQSHSFRLNVPASKMSLDPARPSDFVEWSRSHETPHAFLPRALYGAYVEERFKDVVHHSRGKLRIVRSEAVAIGDRTVTLADGRLLRAERLVLATGLTSKAAPLGLPAHPRVVNAWDEAALHALPSEGRLLVLGSGLSAVDVLGLLQQRAHRGEVLVLSRRGLLPRPHLQRLHPAPTLPDHLRERSPGDLREMVRWVRASVDELGRSDVPWQAGIDSLRPHLPELWQSLSPRDRARFVRRLRPYWDVLRHRAPADALDAIETWKQTGRLQLHAGRVISCEPTAHGLEVQLRLHGGATKRERFDAIVTCVGPAIEQAEGQEPLLRSLLDSGLAARDPAGLGIVTSAEGAVVGADGQASEWITTLGALRRASAWETTAVPEIAVQAHTLADHLLGRA